MARPFLIVLIAGTFIAAWFALGLTAAAASGETISAVDVAAHLDRAKYTSAEIKSYVKGLKGKQVTARGKVMDIVQKRSGVRAVVSLDASGRSDEFIVEIAMKDTGGLHMGEKVSCSGEFTKYNIFTMNKIAIKGTCSK